MKKRQPEAVSRDTKYYACTYVDHGTGQTRKETFIARNNVEAYAYALDTYETDRTSLLSLEYAGQTFQDMLDSVTY